MSVSASFDPRQYKETTRRQWDIAAEAWNRWNPEIEHWLGYATEMMLETTDIGVGSQVLDIAAGTGGQTIEAAKLVGPTGRVLATDISEEVLRYCRRAAREAGLDNVETLVVDGEELDVPEGSFDAAISRVGLIYFPDQKRALDNIHRALRPGGTFAMITYSKQESNPFFSIPLSIVRERAQIGEPALGQPGPFSLGSELVLIPLLEGAGFRNVDVRKVAAPLRMESAKQCVQFMRESFGSLQQMMVLMPLDERERVWQEVERELAQFDVEGGFIGPCELIVACGTSEF